MYDECSELLKELLEAKTPAGPLLDSARLDRAQLCMALLEEAREEAAAHAKFASLGRLAAAVLHELLSPLAFVQTNLEVLSANLPALLAGDAARDTHLADETRQQISESQERIERISTALSALRILLREEPAGPVRGDVRRAAEAAVRLVSMRLPGNVRLQAELGDTPKVSCGDGLIGQVLLHLLLRALDAQQSQDGVIALRSRADPPHWVIVEVEHGAGRSTDEHQLQFSLARHLVERAGGHLERLPRTPSGALFVVQLPAASDSR